MSMILLNAYQTSGFWALMLLGAGLYMLFGCLTFNHLVRDDYHNWVDYGKLEQSEAFSVGLLLSILWPLYWFTMLLYVILKWLILAIIGLVKLWMK